MKLFKLTDSTSQTCNNTQWGKNITHKVPLKSRGKDLCSCKVIHAYKNSNLALLLNPIHAGFKDCNLWEAEGKVIVKDWGKVGCWELTTLKQLDLPNWYVNVQTRKRVQVRFAVLCTESVLKYSEKVYPEDDKPRRTIKATKSMPYFAGYAARAAARAADNAYDAAYNAGDAARSAYYATSAAGDNINFESIAELAVSEIEEK